jgi:large subunit ribosomal protein L4e
MYSPLKTWRKWHRKTNQTQKRHAVAAAVAASAVTPLVMARGHRVLSVPELPLVVDKLSVKKTKNLVGILKRFGVESDLTRSKRSKRVRIGVGKMRNRRYQIRRGPLVIYGDESKEVKKAARNIPGLESAHVGRLNLLQLAPGGHLGRFCIWTKDAFKSLNNVFGTTKRTSLSKKGYHLQRPLLNCADLARIINSDQVQSVLRAPKTANPLHTKKVNPLTNKHMMKKINPFNEKRQ